MFIFLLFFKDDESIPIELRDSEEYHELMELKRLKKIKLQSEGAHVGYKVRDWGDPISL